METDDALSIDIDDESVLSNIFRDKFSESERSNPAFSLYLSRLCSYGIQKLSQEPNYLEDQRAQILEQTQDLAFHNYKTFIRTTECSKNIFQDFGVVEDRLQDTQKKIALLSDHGKSFIKEANDIAAIRKANSLTLTRHTELLEILEIPQLMDTCVRNQYFEDALELMFYVKRLEKKPYISEISIMSKVIKDVHRSSQLMLEQLLGQLQTTILLPACLRIVGYLRRLECFTEMELRLKFLQARNMWLEGILDQTPGGEGEHNAFERITQTIEVSRVHVFDIITQYRAIFSDESVALYSEKQSLTQELSSTSSIFHSWLVYRINCFIEVLKACLPFVIGSRLDSVLGQCMYFGQSFSRVGADFRSLLIPIFKKVALDGFKNLVEQASFEFANDMMSFSLIATAISYNQTSVKPSLTPSHEADLLPPITLLDFTPLAAYVNRLLEVFNQLRVCCALSMVLELPPLINKSVISITNTILQFHRDEEPAFSSSEKKAFVKFCSAFTDDALPHLNACLCRLLPLEIIQEQFGHLNNVYSKYKDGYINIDEPVNMLMQFLPHKQVLSPPKEVKQEVIEEAKPTPVLALDNSKALHSQYIEEGEEKIKEDDKKEISLEENQNEQ